MRESERNEKKIGKKVLSIVWFEEKIEGKESLRKIRENNTYFFF